MFLLGDQEDEVKSYYLDEKKGREWKKKRALIYGWFIIYWPFLTPSPLTHPLLPHSLIYAEKLDKNAQIWLILIADWQGPQLGHLTMPMCVCKAHTVPLVNKEVCAACSSAPTYPQSSTLTLPFLPLSKPFFVHWCWCWWFSMTTLFSSPFFPSSSFPPNCKISPSLTLIPPPCFLFSRC